MSDIRHIAFERTFYEASVRLDYTNHKGVREFRDAILLSLWYGEQPEYHPGKPQFFFHAKALDRPGEYRNFALNDIHGMELRK